MNLYSLERPDVLIAALIILLPFFYAGFFPDRISAVAHAMPRPLRIASPALLCLPYLFVARGFHIFRWEWFALYALLPAGIAFLLDQARALDVGRRGNWRDFLVLLVLGLAVDLRWFEPAWPHGYAAFGKMLLLDAGIFAFLGVRGLDGVGFNLRMKRSDATIGLREFVFYAIVAIPLGLWLGFLHFHAEWPQPLRAIGAFIFTFLFIAVPEELFFRGWLQNLLERRLGRTAALLVTAVVFGLAHWNKQTATFNWRYVIMAAIAGVFYGRAWRAQRRIGASCLTHATVDTLWSLWLR
ncbi:MAG: CPBP family intramembrane glutamic endopeptidase [Terracidiphilus sp.]